jgi:CHAT domain-containing protein
VLSGQLVGYGILHFATHGLLDDEHPERSGLVLSLVDPRGRPRAGVVRAGEIAGLDLPADLVVLSACRTALGREARGEGLLSLTRAFWRAGAARVMVSLWNVDDQATAELMGRFYRALLTGGQRPSTALRAAQLSLRADPRWAPPYYWAGFILQGNWEPLD